jgi:hypothetical protein
MTTNKIVARLPPNPTSECRVNIMMTEAPTPAPKQQSAYKPAEADGSGVIHSTQAYEAKNNPKKLANPIKNLFRSNEPLDFDIIPPPEIHRRFPG